MHSPDQAIFQLLSGHWVSKCLTLAADLNVADHISHGTTSASALAAATHCHEGHLYRVLRLLSAAGVLEERESQEFALTPVGELLRTDHPASMKAMVSMTGNGEHFHAWTKLEEAVRTGGIATDIAEGKDIWAYFRDNPARAAIFNDAMTNFSRLTDRAVAEAFPFGDYASVCDFGGGHGGQIAALLSVFPKLEGVVFDQDIVISGATARFAELGLASRAKAVAGNFFESMYSGAEVYIAKNVIHDWDDEKSLAILKRVRQVIPANGRLILLEITVAGPNIPDPGKFMDVNMLVMTGGRERTSDEFSRLYEASGFKLLEIRPTKSPIHLVIGEPV